MQLYIPTDYMKSFIYTF